MSTHKRRSVVMLCLVNFWAFVPGLSPPMVMAIIAISLYLLIKTQTLILYRQVESAKSSLTDSLLWYVAWPGMNAKEFFVESGSTSTNPRVVFIAAMEVIAGAWLLFGFAPTQAGSQPNIACGCALIGMGLIAERRLFQARILSPGTWASRIWVGAFVVGLIPLLFHQPLLSEVVLPIVNAIGHS